MARKQLSVNAVLSVDGIAASSGRRARGRRRVLGGRRLGAVIRIAIGKVEKLCCGEHQRADCAGADSIGLGEAPFVGFDQPAFFAQALAESIAADAEGAVLVAQQALDRDDAYPRQKPDLFLC